jgi:eukaryotic-like serine/threonine-protein kinase
MAKDPGQRQADATALAAELRTVAAGAYGADWAERGRSHLGEAAVLLAALWPTGGAPSAHGFTSQQLQLSRGHQAAGNQHVHGQQAAHGAQHNATQWHVLHSKHLTHLRHLQWLRTATATAAACAVVAAGVTVAATRAPGGPGTAAHPAVAAYHAPLTPPATISALLNGSSDPAGYFFEVRDPNPDGYQILSGEIKDATPGEVARLYAQQFPYTSQPAQVKSVTLNPVGGLATYSFELTPTLATRYQVRLLQNAAAATPLATTAVKTVYVVYNYSFTFNAKTDICPTGYLPCPVTWAITVYAPPAAISAEMSQPKYLYREVTSTGASQPTSLQLRTNVTFSAPRRVADNAYEIDASFVASPGGDTGNWVFCTKHTGTQDGIGVPGPLACGSESIPQSAFAYIFGTE